MFNDYSAIKNKQQKPPKVFFEQYLYNPSEPFDDVTSDTAPELEDELLENSFMMKRHFRSTAQKIRNRHM